MEREHLREEIIEGYHRMIQERYQYERIVSKYKIPATITEERFNRLRDYFLHYLYPSAEKRREINDAFESLDNHIKHPKQLLRILIDSGSLIFKHGRHLPKILKAGLKALRSFRTASTLEQEISTEAEKSDRTPPYSPEDIRHFMSCLSPKSIEKFMSESLVLFATLHDRKLVIKIIEIVDHLIQKMKKKPKIYSHADIRGLEIGREIIFKGHKLFDELNTVEKGKLFDLVYQIENDAIKQVFEGT